MFGVIGVSFGAFAVAGAIGGYIGYKLAKHYIDERDFEKRVKVD